MILFVPYIGVRVWNAVVMPDELRRPVAVFLWLQACIYTLLMTGLLLARLWKPSHVLLWTNTYLIALQSVVVVLVAFRISKMRAARMLQVLVIGVIAFLFGGSK